MSCASLCLALLLAPPGDAAADPAAAPPVRVALYTDTGAAGDIDGLAALLAATGGMTVERTDAATIRAGGLGGFDLVIHPGGSGSRQGKALGEDGRRAVREFVRDGGGMMGICAGAYLAAGDFGRGRVVCFSPHPESNEETRPMLRRAAFWAAGRPPADADGAAPEAEDVAEDLVYVERGALPIVLSAPHGGRALIPGVPQRGGEGYEGGRFAGGEDDPISYRFLTVRDTGTDQLAVLLADALEARTGARPSLVVARFSRKCVDANRPPEAAAERPAAQAAYARYHAALAEAVRDLGGAGLMIDLHGQGAARGAVFHGTRNGLTTTGRAATDGNPGEQADGKSEAPAEAGRALHLRLADRLRARGLTVLPPDGEAETRYTGGYITWNYGVQRPNGAPAVQLEFGNDLRRREMLRRTADAVADALLDLGLPGVQPLPAPVPDAAADAPAEAEAE